MKKTLFPDGSTFKSRRMKRLAAAALAVAGLLSALPPAARADDTPAADRKAIAADLNRHGFELFRHVSEKDSKENAFISPYSIDSAFGLVYCGAKEKTAQEIRTVLGLPADPAECGRFFDAVSKDYAASEKAEVLVSNSVWYKDKYEKNILPSFIAMIEKYYGGTFYKEDFSKPGPLVKKINAYVEERTKDMIKDLLSPGDITEDTFMILLNTLYFEAKWKTPFKKDDTKPMIFRNFDGKEKRVKMMYRRGYDIAYYSNEEDNVHAVVLPYEDTRFDLIALMPIQPGSDRGEAAMKDIVAKIGDKLDTWLKSRSPYETRLWLPVVDLTCRYSLKEALKELGMTTPFSFEKANFLGIAEPPPDLNIWIEKVIHKTALKMDEVSTKAAAATAIMAAMGGGIGQPPPVNIFRADRPYLVLIRDNKTGLILFAGRINDPGVEATAEDGPVTPSFEGMPFGMPFGMPPSGPGTTAPGSRPGSSTQPIPRQTMNSRPGAAMLNVEPAAAKVDGQISVILEASIDGEDAFAFRDGKVFLEHKTFKTPIDVTVNGKPWEDLSKPFDLGFTPDPASAKFVCEGRGQKIMTRTDDSVTVSIYDSPDAAARYRIVLFQPSGVKDPLELPEKPVEQTVMELPAGGKPASQTIPRQTMPSIPVVTPRTGDSPAANVDGDRNDRDIYAGVPLWNTERDGQPETRLRELVGDAAKRAEADLRSLGSARTISIDAGHSFAEIDFVVVDEYRNVVRFIDEVEKQTPRLSWRRLEIRVETPGRTISGDKPKTVAFPADDVRKFRATGQIRVVKYTPAQKESVSEADAAAPAQEKRQNGTPLSVGDTDFLAKLYDLSRVLPADALVTNFRFNDGRCDFQIQSIDEHADPARYLTNPCWRISKMQKRFISDSLFNFTISLVEEENPPPPQQDGLTRENKVAAIVALNIFDPDRTKKTAGKDKPAAGQAAAPAEPGVMVLEGTFEGRGAFHFVDGLVVYSHKDGTYPTGVKINGQSWVNLHNPVKLPGEPFPARIIRKQARGTVTLLPAEDFARLEIDDHQDGSASYRIELGTK